MTFVKRNTKASKLTAEQVMQIRDKQAAGWTQSRLSRDYQVSIGTIRNIVQGLTWQSLPLNDKEWVETVPQIDEPSPEVMAQSQARLQALLQKKPDSIAIDPFTAPERAAAFGIEARVRRDSGDRMLDEFDEKLNDDKQPGGSK